MLAQIKLNMRNMFGSKKWKPQIKTLVYSNNNKNNETELSEFVKESRLYFQYIGAHVDQNLTLGLLTPLNIKTDINKALVINKAKKTQDKNLLKNFYEDLRKIFLRKYFIKIWLKLFLLKVFKRSTLIFFKRSFGLCFNFLILTNNPYMVRRSSYKFFKFVSSFFISRRRWASYLRRG